jgi:hypothetical protein
VVAAIRAFDLDLSRWCYDITSVSFCGASAEADLVTYGYSRDHRPDRQQVALATTVTAEGGVPLDYQVLAGNVAERTTPVENLRRLQALLATLPPGAPGAPGALADDGGGAGRALLEGVSATEWLAVALDYRPQRAATAPAWEPYHGVLRDLVLAHPEPAQPPLRVRALVVWSPGKARRDSQRRATQLARLEVALHDLAGKLGRRPYTTVANVEQRLTTLLRRHPARRVLTVTVAPGGDAVTDLPVTPGVAALRLAWQRDETALAAAAAVEGRSVLGTNTRELDATRMLTESKRRDVPEQRYALLKGPLAVRPLYLHKHPRILGLVFCTRVALLVFALLELLARRAGLDESGHTLLAQFAPVQVVVLAFADGTPLRHLSGLSPPLARVLAALDGSDTERYGARLA